MLSRKHWVLHVTYALVCQVFGCVPCSLKWCRRAQIRHLGTERILIVLDSLTGVAVLAGPHFIFILFESFIASFVVPPRFPGTWPWHYGSAAE